MATRSAAQVTAPLYFGWYIVATCFFVSFLSLPSRQGFGLFVTEMEPAFGWDRSDVSWLGSVGFLINGAMQPLMGALFDRYGPRRVFGIGLTVMGFAIMSLAFIPDLDEVTIGNTVILLDLIWFMAVFSIVVNTCLSAASITNMLALVVRWFRRKRSKATGLAAAGTSVGGLLMLPFAAYLIGVIDSSNLTLLGVELAGWRSVWFVLGSMVVLLAMPLAVFFLRPNPQQMGLNPDGDPDPPIVAGSGAPAPARSGWYEVSSWRQCFRSPPMWQLSASYVVCGITTGLLSIHFIPYAEDVLPDTVHFLGATFEDKKVFAALIFGVMTGLNAVGVIVTGFMGDRMRRKNVLALVYATRGLAFMALVFLPLFGYGMMGLLAFAVLSGMSWVASVPLTSTLTADVYGFKSLGTISGWVFFAHQIGSFFSIQLTGYAYERFDNSYFWPFLIAGLTLIPAAISAYSIREHHYSSRYNSRPATGQLATAAAGRPY